MARMKKVLSVLCLSLPLLARAYLYIDDRDSVITYSGSSAWQRFPDSSAYKGTTTDNACLTAQNCQFTFSFTGSGVTLTRYIITSIPIPLAATVTIDGIARAGISIPDKSPEAVVYNLQNLAYGLHSMRVVLVSYNGVNSHFRLDYVTVNDTAPTSVPATTSSTIGSLPAKTSLTTSATHSATSLPQAPPKSRKKHIGAIIGGVVGGIAFVILTCVLLPLVVFRRRRQSRVEPPLPVTRGPEAESSQIDPTSGINWATMPPAMSPTVVTPPAGFYPFNASGTDGLILGQRPYLPPPVPEASGIPRAGLPHASIIATQPVVRSPITSSLTNPTAPSTTFIAGASTSEPLPSEVQPTKVVLLQDHDNEDLSSMNITTPRGSTIESGTPSTSSSAPLVPRSTRYLTDEEVEFVATLHRQRLPPSDVARIINNMLDEGEAGNKGEGSNNGIVVTESNPIQPPTYDFKSTGRM